MDKDKFIRVLQEQINYALAELGEGNNLDLRGAKDPYRTNIDNFWGGIKDLDAAWEFVQGAEEWYIDIYENMVSEGRAEYTDYCIASWGEYE